MSTFRTSKPGLVACRRSETLGQKGRADQQDAGQGKFGGNQETALTLGAAGRSPARAVEVAAQIELRGVQRRPQTEQQRGTSRDKQQE